MLPVEIKKDIYWVGSVNFENRDFHGYSLSPQGTTYNAYLVVDDKITLFDSVDAEFTSTMVERINHIVPMNKIDYIVVNHVELDHAGALPEIVKMCNPEKIFCSPMGFKALEQHFDITGWNIEIKKTGDTISLGKRTVSFMETRMLHWPDSMFSYLKEDEILFSNDAFGQNIASTERFIDEVPRANVEHALREYYHNIVLPFSPQVLKVLDQVEGLGLKIDMIAPDHGLIFRGDDVKFVLDTYRKFALQKMQKRALIVYDTMWRSTEKMAYAIAEGLQYSGVNATIMNLKKNHHSSVMTELALCGLVVVGSPTHNNNVLPKVAEVLTYMKGLRPQNRIGAAFGSYGWSGESVNIISEWLKSMNMEIPVNGIKNQYVPKAKVLEDCFNMGKELGEELIKRCGC